MGTQQSTKSRIQPRSYQLDAIEFMLEHKKCFNLSDPRTGKTATCLWAIEKLQKKHKDLTVLIVAPASTINFTWWQEIEKLNIKSGNIKVINYHWLHRLDEYSYDVVIIDEFTFLKNPNSIRSKAFKQLKCKYLWALSGTPVTQSAMDMYVLLTEINPNSITNTHGKLHSYKAVKYRLYDEISLHKFVPRKDLLEIVSKLLRPSFRVSLKDTGLAMEATYRETIEVPLRALQIEALGRLKHECTVAVEEFGYEAVFLNRAVWTNKALQICSGFNYTDRGAYMYGSDKFNIVQALMETHSSSKIIVFSSFSAVLEHMQQLHPNAELVNGAVSEKDRLRIFNSFQNGGLNLLLMNPRSCSHGLTLSSGDVIIWFDPTSSETMVQANFRIARESKNVQQFIYYLWSAVYDKRGYQAAKTKEDFQNELFDMLLE